MLQREKVFAQQAEERIENGEHKQEQDYDLTKFKQVGFELLDIGIYYGQQGVTKVKSLPLY